MHSFPEVYVNTLLNLNSLYSIDNTYVKLQIQSFKVVTIQMKKSTIA